MLHYFGLKEIFFGTKRLALVVVLCTVLLSIIGVGLNLVGNDETPIVQDELFYASSRSYVLTANKDEELNLQSAEDRACAQTGSAMINADFSKAYVFENLLKEYSKSEIIEYTGAKLSEDQLNHTALNECINVSVLTDAPIINFFAKTKDQAFSEKTIALFDEYFNQKIIKDIPNLKEYRFLGGTNVIVNDSTENNIVESQGSLVKNAIIFGAIGLVLSMIYVLFSVLFCPSIASEGDFVDYGVSVLDNAKDHRMNKKEFAVAAIAKAMNKEDVALVSTIGEKRFARLADELSDDLGQKIVYNMISDFDEFEKIRTKKKAIFIERTGVTTHDVFSSSLNLLKQYDIEVVGVVLL